MIEIGGIKSLSKDHGKLKKEKNTKRMQESSGIAWEVLKKADLLIRTIGQG